MRALYAFGLLLAIGASAAAATRFVPETEPQSRVFALKTDAPSSEPPVQRKATFEVRQAPVPIRWATTHQAVPVPQENGTTISDILKQAAGNGTPATDPGTGAAAAKAAIEADGYKGVRGLVQTADGKWTGRALRGKTEISVTVSSDGSVSAN